MHGIGAVCDVLLSADDTDHVYELSAWLLSALTSAHRHLLTTAGALPMLQAHVDAERAQLSRMQQRRERINPLFDGDSQESDQRASNDALLGVVGLKFFAKEFGRKVRSTLPLFGMFRL